MKCNYFLIFIVFSCKIDSKVSDFKFESFQHSIPISTIIPVNPGTIQLAETDSGQYLFLYNNYRKKYQFLNFENGNIVYEISVDFEDKDGIRELSGGVLFDRDTIWNLVNPSSIILLNFDGEVILKRNFINQDTPVRYVNAFQHKPLFKHKNSIFGTQPLFVDPLNMEASDVEKHKLAFSYDYKEDSVEWHEVYYPDNYWTEGKKIAELSWAKRGEELYIAPWYDHQVQVFDLNSKKVVNRSQVKSSYVNNFLYSDKVPSSQYEGLLNRLIYDRYESLIYDKYRDVFYRIFLPKMNIQEEYSIEMLRDLNWNRQTVGIMVIDSNLNILGEIIFENNEVFPSYNYFVGKEGLYLSRNNLFNEEYDEEHLKYIIIKFGMDL